MTCWCLGDRCEREVQEQCSDLGSVSDKRHELAKVTRFSESNSSPIEQVYNSNVRRGGGRRAIRDRIHKDPRMNQI